MLLGALVLGTLGLWSRGAAGGQTVETEWGRVVGRTLGGRDGAGAVEAFLGLPFAQPPVGRLRWKRPVDRKPWPEPWDARQYRWACPQQGPLRPYSREDCLYLNVWTPTLNPQAALPVLVWLHGGEFAQGSAMLYPGVEDLVRRGIVVVSANYRLGPFAFFSTKSSSASGNLALLDQLAALRWVRSTVQLFGGSPQKVTLAGSGAGAVSASLLSLLPAAQGLFHRLILQSGGALVPGVVDEAMSERASARLALNAGCADEEGWASDPAAALPCLHSRSWADVLDFGSLPLSYGTAHPWQWSFRLDGRLFPRSLNALLRQRRPLDVILGRNADEYGLKIHQLLRKDSSLKRHFDPDTLLADIGQVSLRFPQWGQWWLRDLAKAVYVDSALDVKGGGEWEFWMEQTVRLYSEARVGGPVFQEASTLKAGGAAVYLYELDFLSGDAMWGSPYRGVVEGWETAYLFASPGNVSRLGMENYSPSAADLQLSEVVGELWASFVRTGRPSASDVRWAPLQLDADAGRATRDYLALRPRPVMQRDFCPRCISLWAALASPVPAPFAGRPSGLPRLESWGEACYASGYYYAVWALSGALGLLLLGLLLALCLSDFSSSSATYYTAPKGQDHPH